MASEWRPWEKEGISEVDFWKAKYLEARLELAALMRATGFDEDDLTELLDKADMPKLYTKVIE